MVVVLDGIIVKANDSACSYWGFDIIGKKLIDLFDPSEHETIHLRIFEFLNYNRGGRRMNIYLSNGNLTEPFYVGVKSKLINYDGQKAILGIGKKIEIPVQIPLNYSG